MFELEPVRACWRNYHDEDRVPIGIRHGRELQSLRRYIADGCKHRITIGRAWWLWHERSLGIIASNADIAAWDARVAAWDAERDAAWDAYQSNRNTNKRETGNENPCA